MSPCQMHLHQIHFQGPIVENLLAAGLEKDCPFLSLDATDEQHVQVLTAETVEAVPESAFMEYAGKISVYLQV